MSTLLVFGVLTASSLAGQEQLVDRIAAVVNDEVITIREVQRAAAPLLMAIARVEDPLRRSKERAQVLAKTLDDLVGQALVLQEARRLNLDASEAEVDAWLNNLKRQYGWSDEAMKQAVTAQGATLVTYREDVRRRILTNRVVQMKLGSSVRVSEQQVEDALQQELAKGLDVPELEARHILFQVGEDAPTAEAESQRDRAREVLAALREGTVDFPTAAARHSEGPTASRGGKLGSFRPGQLHPSFEKAALAAEVGELIGPVRTPFGWHVIQVTRRRVVQTREKKTIRQEARARLRQQGLQRQLKLWVDELKRQAHVENRL